MFITYDVFKFPIQLDAESTVWDSVEMAVSLPWFIATVLDPEEDLRRSFFLSRVDLLLTLIERSPFGEVLALQLVQPRRATACVSWSILPVSSVQRSAGSDQPSRPRLYFTTHGGEVYDGSSFELAETANLVLAPCWRSQSS